MTERRYTLSEVVEELQGSDFEDSDDEFDGDLDMDVEEERDECTEERTKGCLSNIPPQAGTNRNENLHRFINPYFRRSRMGIPLALDLLTILFHHHNKNIPICNTFYQLKQTM